MTKKKVLIIALALGLIIVGVAFVLIWPVRDNWRQQYLYHKILGEFSALENAYKNDPYGGSTPEETLKLFIEALQKGDIDLASKYFVPEKREEYRQSFVNWKKNSRLETNIAILSNYSKPQKQYEDLYISTINNQDSVLSIEIFQNRFNNKWLIKSL